MSNIKVTYVILPMLFFLRNFVPLTNFSCPVGYVKNTRETEILKYSTHVFVDLELSRKLNLQ
jgi:hypothetical protein